MEFSNIIPDDVLAVQEMPRVKELVSQAGEINVRAYIEAELIKLVALTNVGGNLTDIQIQFIAAELIKEYPNESIGDFKKCFSMGAMGKFGDIFRLDGIIIHKWMKAYLDYKYQVIEDKMYKEKEKEREPIVIDKGVVDDERRNIWLKKWADSLGTIDKLRPITREEIAEEGRRNPIKKNYTPLSEAEVHERNLHLQYIRENYNPRTGDPLPTWVEEKEWRKQNRV